MQVIRIDVVVNGSHDQALKFSRKILNAMSSMTGPVREVEIVSIREVSLSDPRD